MFTKVTAFNAAIITLAMGGLQLASAETNTFDTSVKASSENAIAATACDEAFAQAETEAVEQLEEYFQDTHEDSAFKAILTAQNETRTLRDNGKTVCVFEGSWRGSSLGNVNSLIGTEQFIDGAYNANCLDERNGNICWQRIVRQANTDLRQQLSNQYGDISFIHLNYLDFEGRQRDQYRQKRLEMTADGRFFFNVDDSHEPAQTTTTIAIERHNDSYEQAEDYNEPNDEPAVDDKDKEPEIDLTLFYAWDGNDSAQTDDLAISTERWGVGLWANNRIGFSVFRGSDQLGIANNNQSVKTVKGSYETTGVGMGYRLWKNRGVTLENMLYYVDAQPYQATIAPGCNGCTSRTFRSEDYLQATVNLKTNSNGLNVGWMFTWKILERESNIDSLSSGFYLELQI